MVDEQTGDPTFLAQPGVGRTGDPLWIPAAAHTDGVGGARWRTDLTMMNPGSHDLVTRVELLGPDGVVATTTVHVPDGRVRQFPDVISETFATEGGGALRITPTFGLVMATSRTYATTADGSHGQGIPGVAGSMAFTGDEVAFLPGLRQDTRFRTNIGIANTGDGAIDIEVTAHARTATNSAPSAIASRAHPGCRRTSRCRGEPFTPPSPPKPPGRPITPTPRSSIAQPTTPPTSPPCVRRIGQVLGISS